ncbi:uncharacterized protein SOCE26_018560 [Sorangium cellulosum]|uniref:Uncharacterized protein n=1 Tax=Sorangium cellulosum TaxID=56 RepID=A0A2L0EME8_SORCE|nr:hypothetical protein [Sorangium cellulosum]AUX40455.1 uncharacterized protein SOCE26_018560 [Sorangium cellulosum]
MQLPSSLQPSRVGPALITRRVPLDRWAEALVREPADVKPSVTFT